MKTLVSLLYFLQTLTPHPLLLTIASCPLCARRTLPAAVDSLFSGNPNSLSLPLTFFLSHPIFISDLSCKEGRATPSGPPCVDPPPATPPSVTPCVVEVAAAAELLPMQAWVEKSRRRRHLSRPLVTGRCCPTSSARHCRRGPPSPSSLPVGHTS